jgi:predicted NBD/HSP70 family sugar kinase
LCRRRRRGARRLPAEPVQDHVPRRTIGAGKNAWGSFEGSGWQAIGAFLDAADAGEPAAAVLEQAIEALGAALGSIVNLANPERIVIGGWVGMRLMERYAARIAEWTRRNSLVRSAEQFDLVAATFGGDTVALGSALMPFEALVINAPR